MLRKIAKWFSGDRIRRMPPQVNQQAIVNWQQWLNVTFPPGPWIPIDGFNAMVSFSFGPNGVANFNGNSGYPLKGFVNTSTGEVKIFDGRKFLIQQG